MVGNDLWVTMYGTKEPHSPRHTPDTTKSRLHCGRTSSTGRLGPSHPSVPSLSSVPTGRQGVVHPLSEPARVRVDVIKSVV